MRMTMVLFVIASFFSTAFADAPLRPPSIIEVWSANKKYVAVLEYKETKISVFSVQQKGERKKLWEMAGWFRWTHLSNDGKYLDIPYWGANLLTLDYNRDEIMLRIVKRGKTTTVLKLSDLIRDFSKLQRTVSHYHWGNYVGFNEKNEFVIETVEGNLFLVSPVDGKLKESK